MRGGGEWAVQLSKGPLMRVKLIRESPGVHVLLITMHHIITDEWSIGILVQEVVKKYEAACEGRAIEIEELPIQYADYSVWQQKFLSGEELDRQMRYWRGQLEGAPEALEMPTDRPRPPVQTNKGAFEQLVVGKEVAERLKQVGRSERATLFMTMMAAFKILLYRYSGRRDILVGTPIANRNRAECEGLIGFFVNTLVIRTQMDPRETFGSVVRKVRESSIGAYAHQDLPFEKLVDEMQPTRSLSHNPIFQVMVVLQNAGRRGAEMKGLKLGSAGSGSLSSKFDILMGVVETGEGLSIGITYNSDLYECETVKRMCAHLRRVLEELISNEGRAISDLEMMTEEERHQVIVEWNDTKRRGDGCRSVVEMFEREAEKRSEAVAIRCGEVEVSYGELNRRANQVAHYLRRRGVGPEELVMICMERSVEMVVGMMGVMKAGGGYVPLDVRYPRERLRMIEEDAGGGLILTEEKFGGMWEGTGSERVIALDRAWEEIGREERGNPSNCVNGENIAYVIYTSGSTGRAKGVGIEHRSAVELAEWSGEEYGGGRIEERNCDDIDQFRSVDIRDPGGVE